MSALMGRSEVSLKESVLSFGYEDSGAQIRVLRVVNRCFYLVAHLPSAAFSFSDTTSQYVAQDDLKLFLSPLPRLCGGGVCVYVCMHVCVCLCMTVCVSVFICLSSVRQVEVTG